MDYDELRTWIRTAAELWVSEWNTEESRIDDMLAAQGCDPELAQIIFEFLPVVFSEHILERMGVTRLPTYSRRLTDGSRIECRFEDDPVYLAIRHFMRDEAVARWDDYKVIAACCADFQAMNDALHQGAEVAGSVSAFAPVDALSPDCRWLPVRRE